MSNPAELTPVALAVEIIRSVLRALPESAQAEVRRELLTAPTEDNERKRIDDALAAAGGTIEGAAEILGIARRTLMVHMRTLGYEPRKGGGQRKRLV